MKILGIREGDSLDQAKKAFRHLAKQYHPDRFARDPALAEARLNQMKQVNQAFHFLAPLLQQEGLSSGRGAPVSFPPGKGSNQEGVFLAFFQTLRKGVESVLYPKPGASPTPSPKPFSRQKVRQGSFPGQADRFGKILHSLQPGFSRSPGISGSARGLRQNSGMTPLSNYKKYMSLKKQVDARLRMQDCQDIGRIEKITPISRVAPIEGE